MHPQLIIVPIVVLIIVIAVVSHLLAAQRRKDLATWAAARGFSFSADRDASFESCHGPFSCLANGSNRYAFNVMRGRHKECLVTAFDYHYETYTHSKNGRHTHHHYFSGVIVDAGMPLKPLVIRTEGLLDKIGGFIGFEDIDFESAEFSRTFYVSAPDRKWAFDVIQQSTMEFLLGAAQFTLEFAGHEIIAYRTAKFAVDDFAPAIRVIEGILDRLPLSLRPPSGITTAA